MILDSNPSILLAVYADPEDLNKLEAELRSKGAGVREWRLLDIAIEPDRIDEIQRFLKSFLWYEYAKGRSPIKSKLSKWIAKIFFKKTIGYQFIDFSKVKKWDREPRSQYANVMALPVAVEDTTAQATNETEKKQIQRLIDFSTEYEPKEKRRSEESFKSIEDLPKSNSSKLDHKEI